MNEYTETIERQWTWEWNAVCGFCAVSWGNDGDQSITHEREIPEYWPERVKAKVRYEVCVNRPLADDETREKGRGWRIGKMSITEAGRLRIDFGSESCEYDRSELSGARLAFFDRNYWDVRRGTSGGGKPCVVVESPKGSKPNRSWYTWCFGGEWSGADVGKIPPHIKERAEKLWEEMQAEKAANTPLKPCPFCGAESAMLDQSNGTDEVVCGSCQAYTWGNTPVEAVAAWNRREPTDELTEFGGFGVDPRDSKALLRLLECIDDHGIWPSDRVKEAGDYEACIRYMADVLLRVRCLTAVKE